MIALSTASPETHMCRP